MSNSPRRVYVVSLGCPKNLVDTERMVGQLLASGDELTSDPDAADLFLLNTCAFIESARQESVSSIMELAELRERRPGSKLVVAGCLAQRYASELRAELPEVDFFVGTGEYMGLQPLLALEATEAAQTPEALGLKKARPSYLASHLDPRYVAEGSFSNYLKIAEGCSQGCAFCVIPRLRGGQRSRPVQDVVQEARALVQAGAVELNLVAQDLTHYGEERGEREALARLIRALGEIEGLRWVRLMYAYPDGFNEALIDAIAETANCLPYVDMPLQHATDHMLTLMNRHTNRAEIDALLSRLRERLPGLVLRTTLLVGHPGETEADFDALCDFVREQRFDHLGCFVWSAEEGTPSARQPDRVDPELGERRQETIMALQREIAAEKMAARVGRRQEVLVEGLSEETDLLLQGRAWWQAPEIDGCVYINDAPDDIGAGQLRQVEISETAGPYDLVGHAL